MRYSSDESIRCLNHGFVRPVETMGNDEAIVSAARVSYGSGTKSVREDRDLIRYLLKHKHTTPFEMCEIKLHCKMPIFVARQWIRHRTASVNEYSARYSTLDKEFYIPDDEQLGVQSSSNKQGRDDPVNEDDARAARRMIQINQEDAYIRYEGLLEKGIAREIARMVLPLNIYTQWYWKIDLHNLFHFLKLRLDPHAQYEIRVYADAIWSIVKNWVPVAAEAFKDYQLDAVTLSAQELKVVQAWTQENHQASAEIVNKLSMRELRELRRLFP